jgi:hypothetical protein
MVGKKLADLIIERAKRTPYKHLYHADGSVYMERFWLRPYSDDYNGIAARVHHIVTPDYDRELHDHPWDFVSIVLRGGYTEARPIDVEPCFAGTSELVCHGFRGAGSIARRRATDRHRITDVMSDTWTLFVTGAKRQWWGFYGPTGKIHWKDFESVHSDATVARP